MRWIAAAALVLACAMPMHASAQTTDAAPIAVQTTTNHGIVALGMAIWTTTYLPSLLIGLFAGLDNAGCGSMSAAFDVPFGALAAGIALPSCNGPSSDIAFGYAFGIGQIVGLAVAIAGATFFRRMPVGGGDAHWTSNGFAIDF